MAWRLAPVVAEAIIASPSIAPESIDAHLIRVGARLLGIVGAMALLAVGRRPAGRAGVRNRRRAGRWRTGHRPRRPADDRESARRLEPVRGQARSGRRSAASTATALGTVEAIGIRSTRMRGIDRTLTTIPNAALAKMPIVNFARRDRMLIQTVIGLRYETTPEQLRYVLVKLREMLLGHPRVEPRSGARALRRLRGQLAQRRGVRLRDDADWRGIPRHPGRHPAARRWRSSSRPARRSRFPRGRCTWAATRRTRARRRLRKRGCGRGGRRARCHFPISRAEQADGNTRLDRLSARRHDGGNGRRTRARQGTSTPAAAGDAGGNQR